MTLSDDMAEFKDDLDGIRSGGSSSGGNGGSVGKDDVPDLGLGGDSDGEDGPWLANFKKGVYLIVALAMFQAVVGPIPIPDATLLYVFALGFLVLGLWAGATKHAELRAAWARFEEWRG